MRRSIRHVGVAVAASAALGTLGISGLATAAAATAARQPGPVGGRRPCACRLRRPAVGPAI